MRQLIQFLMVFCFSLIMIGNSNAQWTQTNGPYGREVNCFADIDSNLFVGTNDGVFLSINNGNSWALVSTGLPSTYPVYALGVIGANLFAAIGYGAVFISTNYGKSWASADSGLPAARIYAFTVIGSNLFAGTDGGGVFLTTNFGDNWNAVNSGLTDYGIRTLITFPNNSGGTNLLAGTAYWGIDQIDRFSYYAGSIFLSTNNGSSWECLTHGVEGYISLVVVPDGKGGTNLIAGTIVESHGTLSGSVKLSADNGLSWKVVQAGIAKSISTASNGIGGLNIFAGTEKGVFLSKDFGASWTAINIGSANSEVSTVFARDAKIFVGTSKEGLFLSTNNGVDWSAVSTGLNFMSIAVLVASDTNIFASSDDGGVFRSTNNGYNWTPINFGLTCSTIKTLAYGSNGTGGTNLIAGDDLFSVFHSTNNGDTWAKVNTGLIDVRINSLNVKDSNLYIGTDHRGIIISNNNGKSWRLANNGLLDTSYISIAIYGDDLFASTYYEGRVFRSTTNGYSWEEVTTPLPNKEITSLFVSNKNIYANIDGSVFRTTNSGKDWTRINNKMWSDYSHRLTFAVKDSYIFVNPRSDKELFLSTDNGDNWEAINLGITNSIYSIVANNKSLFAGTYNGGVWRRELSDIVDVKTFKSVNCGSYYLYQNYPNPFNPSTIIEYAVPKESYIKIIVYDLLGREIKKLVDEKKSVGSYKVEFDGNGLPSGVYLCRLKTNEYNETRKLLLMK